MLLSAVEGLYVLGERDRAAGLYELVVECIERTRAICPNYNDMRLLERTAGIAAAAGRCWDDAEEHFRTALRQAGELPHLPEQAHTRRFFASHARRAGRPRRPGRGGRPHQGGPRAVRQHGHAQARGHAGRYLTLIQPSRLLLSGTPKPVSVVSR